MPTTQPRENVDARGHLGLQDGDILLDLIEAELISLRQDLDGTCGKLQEHAADASFTPLGLLRQFQLLPLMCGRTRTTSENAGAAYSRIWFIGRRRKSNFIVPRLCSLQGQYLKVAGSTSEG